MESSPVFPALQPVQPVSPVAPYLGGKRALARELTSRISAIEHAVYAEPFVGMGGVFFRRPLRPKLEVINDISSDVATLFRILQRHYQSFVDELKWRFSSRAEFERLMAVDPSTLTDLERAARFLYLQRTAFGGKVEGRHFGVDLGRSRFNMATLGKMLDDVHERLHGVTIERLLWADFIRRYDSAGTLFYLDPPYFGCETGYGPGVFDRGEFAKLSATLAHLKGRFILSINDTSEIREAFGAFEMQPVGLSYRVSGKATPARELIISK